MDIKKDKHLWEAIKRSLEGFRYTFYCTVLLSELMLSVIYEYIIISHHIKIDKYVSI